MQTRNIPKELVAVSVCVCVCVWVVSLRRSSGCRDGADAKSTFDGGQAVINRLLHDRARPVWSEVAKPFHPACRRFWQQANCRSECCSTIRSRRCRGANFSPHNPTVCKMNDSLFSDVNGQSVIRSKAPSRPVIVVQPGRPLPEPAAHLLASSFGSSRVTSLSQTAPIEGAECREQLIRPGRLLRPCLPRSSQPQTKGRTNQRLANT